MTAAAVRLRPLEYVQLYGPPAKRCSGCEHAAPDEHEAGGRLDRLVLEDLATWASWRRDDWGDRTFPSVPEIARRIGYSERSVQYAMRRLERSGFIERVERPGFTSWCRIMRVVEPVDELADVVNFSVEKRRRSRRRNSAPLHPPGATVAPELGDLTTTTPPVAPDSGLDESDAAAAAAQRGAPMAPRRSPATSGTGPPLSVGVVAEPHRQDAEADAAVEADGPSRDAVVAVLRTAVDGPAPPGDGDVKPQHWSRAAARQLRPCPRCAAPAGEACRNRAGRLRKANHRERSIPR